MPREFERTPDAVTDRTDTAGGINAFDYLVPAKDNGVGTARSETANWLPELEVSRSRRESPSIEELTERIDDWKMLEEMFGHGADFDFSAAKETFTKWLENIPLEQRMDRLHSLQHKISGGEEDPNFELEIVEENGELTEVNLLNHTSIDAVSWMIGLYRQNLYERES